MADIH